MESRREQIVQAACDIAAERGLAAVTVRAVAFRVGIGASTLRHYFPTQDDLFHEVVGRSFHPHLDDLDIHESSIPAASRLLACMAQFLPADESQVGMLEGWLALHAAAVGPSRTEQGARLLGSLTEHARVRASGWLEILEAEEALQPGRRERHLTTMLATIDGLCLHLVSGGTTVDEAHAVLKEVITRLVVAPRP